jgi:hypothetical protein
MKLTRFWFAGCLALLTLAGCAGDEQPQEGSADITKTRQTAEMPKEQADRNMRDIGLDPNNPAVRGNRRH